jgi:hypothetical protein
MAMTLDAVVSLANQTARDSQYGANGAMREAEQAMAKQRDRPIVQGSTPTEGKKKFDDAAQPITPAQAASKIKQRMAPVDPMEQASLLMLLPKDQQDYATVTYQILADKRMES